MKENRHPILDLIFPRRCPVCFGIVDSRENFADGLCCRACYPKLQFVTRPTCFCCGRSITSALEEYCNECKKNRRNFVRGVALLDYSGPVSAKLLWKLKYENGREYADFLCHEMLLRYGDLIRSWKVDCVIPVPVHSSKKRERGYNQAEVLAKLLAKELSLPLETKALLRASRTRAQKELTRQQRYDNLRHAFSASKRAGRYKKVLLVDDIFTTGSTAYVCTEILRAQGVEAVYLCNFSIGKTEETLGQEEQ